jgi:hypothetical protein
VDEGQQVAAKKKSGEYRGRPASPAERRENQRGRDRHEQEQVTGQERDRVGFRLPGLVRGDIDETGVRGVMLSLT